MTVIIADEIYVQLEDFQATRKSHDMVPHSWILKCHDILGISNQIAVLLEDIMRSRSVKLICGYESPGQVHMERGIFKEDSLSPLCYVSDHIGTFYRPTK